MANTAKTTVGLTQEKETARVLARTLVDRKQLTLQQAKEALSRVGSKSGLNSLEDVLIDSKVLSEDAILETKASLWNVPFIDLTNYEVDPEVLDMIPGNVARQYMFFPLFRLDGTLLLAMADPKNVKAIDKVTQLTQLDISPALSSSRAIQQAIDQYYGDQP